MHGAQLEPRPHSVAFWRDGETHWPKAVQQPVVQLVASQTHWPREQR